MKQLLLTLTLLLSFCLAAHADKVKLVPSAGDSTQMDTVVFSELQDDETIEDYSTHSPNEYIIDGIDAASSILLVSIIMGCGLPLFIVSIALWFRYKNRQAKYRLAAKALAAGQNIPQELFNDARTQHQKILSKGIKNIFLGIGLGVFLWIWSDTYELAAIGFLIFCMGIGQVLIAYTTRPNNDRQPNQQSSDEE